MYARASRSPETFPSYEISDVLDNLESEDFFAGEPISAANLKGPSVVSYAQLLFLVLAAIGWGFASDADTRQQWASKFEEVVAAANNLAQPPSAQPQPLPSKEIASAEPAPLPATSAPPPAAAAPQALPQVTINEAPGTKQTSSKDGTKEDAVETEYTSTPTVPSDPYRKRAEAAGLHPDLSKVLLARLTTADYRNAAFAIDKAVKTIPDDGEFTWPRTKKTGVAVFNVHFVPGAGHDCRRYVVTITKDRWSTTALPMEKCGVKVAYRSPAKEKTIE